MRKAFDLRPLEFNDILGRSLALFTSHFVGVMRWFLVGWLLPVLFVAVLAYLALEPDRWTRVPGAEAPSLFEPGRYAAWIWIVKLATVTFAFTTGAAGIYYLAARAYVGDRPSLTEIARHVYQRLGHVLGAGFLKVLVIVCVTLALVVPPIMLWSDNKEGEALLLGMLTWSLYPVVLMWFLGTWGLNVATTLLDDAHATEGFSRSSFLTKKFRTRLVGVILTVALVVGAPGIPGLMTVPAAIVEVQLVDEGLILPAELLRILWDCLLLPLFFVPLVVFYFDMRCRKESYDLAVMARNFGIAEGEMQRYRFNPHMGYVPKGYKGPVGRRRKPVRKPQPRPSAARRPAGPRPPRQTWGPQPGMPQQAPPPGAVPNQPWPQQQAPPPGAMPNQPWPPRDPPPPPPPPPNPNAPPLPDWNRRRS